MNDRRHCISSELESAHGIKRRKDVHLEVEKRTWWSQPHAEMAKAQDMAVEQAAEAFEDPVDAAAKAKALKKVCAQAALPPCVRVAGLCRICPQVRADSAECTEPTRNISTWGSSGCGLAGRSQPVCRARSVRPPQNCSLTSHVRMSGGDYESTICGCTSTVAGTRIVLPPSPAGSRVVHATAHARCCHGT